MRKLFIFLKTIFSLRCCCFAFRSPYFLILRFLRCNIEIYIVYMWICVSRMPLWHIHQMCINMYIIYKFMFCMWYAVCVCICCCCWCCFLLLAEKETICAYLVRLDTEEGKRVREYHIHIGLSISETGIYKSIQCTNGKETIIIIKWEERGW